ncbi:hypothetical protein ACFV9C_42675 [Kribbella sp. NPDC059898]|uniref:hypothetical protein n=1 Tax=Kribbella sp. NPDC059898 TaxID=3346995 RepID=UPI0036652534
MSVILMHPTASGGRPTMDAEVLFGHSHHPHRRTKVRQLTIDGVEYFTNGPLVIRGDRLHGLDPSWTWMKRPVTIGLKFLADALNDEVTAAIPVQRFHADVICALEQCNARIAVLAGTHSGNLHAVLHDGAPVGLAVPIPDHLMASRIGVIPGHWNPSDPASPDMPWFDGDSNPE